MFSEIFIQFFQLSEKWIMLQYLKLCIDLNGPYYKFCNLIKNYLWLYTFPFKIIGYVNEVNWFKKHIYCNLKKYVQYNLKSIDN